MTKIDKVRQRFAECQGGFPYRDFVKVIQEVGYEELNNGTTSGSRRKFKSAGDLIMLDEPHDGTMKSGMVKRLQKQLRGKGLL